MRKISFWLILAMFGLSGCPGGDSQNYNNRPTSTGNNTNISSNTIDANSNTNRGNANANTMSQSGANDFMTKAALGGMAEVKLGEMASTKAQNADVKTFGKKMVEDHSKANTELTELAKKKGVTLPTETDAAHKATMDKLSKLSGAEFDKEYVSEMVKDHEKDVAEFEEQSKNATDADIKAFATKTLPTLKMHLQMIKDIHAKMK
jgi:putative membrane protein